MKKIIKFKEQNKIHTISLNSNEQFIACENGIAVKARSGKRMIRDFNVYGSNWRFVNAADVKTRFIPGFENKKNYLFDFLPRKRKGRRDLNDIVEFLANSIYFNPERKERDSLVSIEQAKKILYQELIINQDMTDYDIFMFVFYEIFNQNYQSTVIFLEGILNWSNSETVKAQRESERNTYYSFFKSLASSDRINYALNAERILNNENQCINYKSMREKIKELINNDDLNHVFKENSRTLNYSLNDYVS